MPFLARCHRCGHVEEARTRYFIDLGMVEHDTESHDSHDPEEWTVAVISNSDFHMVQRLAKTPAFWQALRTKHPRFSDWLAGRLAFLQTERKVADGVSFHKTSGRFEINCRQNLNQPLLKQ